MGFVIHKPRISFLTPLTFASVLNCQFTGELTVPWNILPFSFFFYSDDLTRHVHRCTHGVNEL